MTESGTASREKNGLEAGVLGGLSGMASGGRVPSRIPTRSRRVLGERIVAEPSDPATHVRHPLLRADRYDHGPVVGRPSVDLGNRSVSSAMCDGHLEIFQGLVDRRLDRHRRKREVLNSPARGIAYSAPMDGLTSPLIPGLVVAQPPCDDAPNRAMTKARRQSASSASLPMSGDDWFRSQGVDT